MMYQEEFYRMKKIYDQMLPAKRDMIGPMLALPPVSMALFFLALLPFGLANLALVIFVGAISTLISAVMIALMVDIRKEIAEWRATAPATAESPGEIAIQMFSIANDPGQKPENAAEKASAQG